MESTCLFCLSPVPLLIPVSDCRSHHSLLFDAISSSLSVEKDVQDMWNFADDILPFCTDCRDKVEAFSELKKTLDGKLQALSDLQKDLGSTRLDIAVFLEEVKAVVSKSAKISRNAAAGAETSARFKQFRQQVLYRRICSARVERYVGCGTVPRPGSVVSDDDLSMDSASQASGVEGMNIKTEPEELVPIPLEIDTMGWVLTQNEVIATPGPEPGSVGDNFAMEVLLDAEDPNRVADTPAWAEYEDGRLTFGYVSVIMPKAECGTTAWKCGATDCEYEFEGGSKKHPKKAMARHITITHYPKRKCPGCQNTFETFTAMQDHPCTVIKPKEKSAEKRCRKCSVLFDNLSLLKLHNCPGRETPNVEGSNTVAELAADDVSEQQPEDQLVTPKPKIRIFKCKTCSKPLCSKAGLERHQQTHTSSDEAAKVICEICGKEVKPWQLTRHKRDVHGIGTPKVLFPCDFEDCGKVFQNLTKLNRHRITHSKEEDGRRTRSNKKRIITPSLDEGSEAKISCGT